MSDKRKLTDAQMDDLCAHLRGSCGSLDGSLISHFGIEEDDLTIEDSRALDDRLFCCDGCGWWCEAGDEAADGYCEECTDTGGEE